jgi:hypothetical protein
MEDMGKIFENILKHMLQDDLQMIIAIAIIIFVLFMLWLIMRAPRLWYWKTKDKVNALKKIEDRLNQMEGKVDINKIYIDHGSKKINLEKIEEIKEIKEALKEQENDMPKNKFEENEKFVGKSGKIYTRKDLEDKIKN